MPNDLSLEPAPAFAKLRIGRVAERTCSSRITGVFLVGLAALILRSAWLSTLVGVNFDSYEQLAAARRLLAGDLPLSDVYPPGIAIVMAVPMLLLPHTLATMQGAIIVFGVALAGFSYVCAARISRDRVAALAFGAVVATAPIFVYYSRVVLFDVLITLVVALLVMVPWAFGRPRGASAVLYGALLGLGLSMKATMVLVLPAVVIAWTMSDGSVLWDWRSLKSRSFLTTAIVAVTLVSGMMLASPNSQLANARIDLGPNYFARAGVYFILTFSDVAGLVVLPFAVVGARALARTNRGLALSCAYVVVAWPVAHAPISFFEIRYMMPAMYFALFLAVIGGLRLHRTVDRPATRLVVVIAAAAVAALFVGRDAVMLAQWPDTAAASDEAAYQRLRPIVAALPDGALLVTAHARGVRDSNPRLEYVDLIDASTPGGTVPENVRKVRVAVAEALNHGRPVFYLEGNDHGGVGLPGPGFHVYLDDLESIASAEDAAVGQTGTFRLWRLQTRR